MRITIQKNKEKKREYSKWLISLVLAVNLALTVLGLLYMFINEDSTIFSYIVGVWGVEFATATGFYYNKAKAENLIKIGGTNGYNDDDTGFDTNDSGGDWTGDCGAQDQDGAE